MGNTSNPEQWAVLERLRFIERAAYWRGWVQRQDLSAVFGKGSAQASADFQKYQELNPGALAYSMNRKRYEGTEQMALVVTQPNLEEAMALFLSGGAEALGAAGVRAAGMGKQDGPPRVQVVRMPVRRPPPHVERKVFLAVLNGLRLRVKYYSVNSGTDDWRWIRPRIFAHDGNRWHVRAWCELRNHWADFTLSRMADAEWPVSGDPPPLPDNKAESLSTIRMRPHHGLSDTARRGVELDYGMINGMLELTIPANIADYLRTRLGLPLSDGTKPQPLLEVAE